MAPLLWRFAQEYGVAARCRGPEILDTNYTDFSVSGPGCATTAIPAASNSARAR